jgi:DNA replication protein DnaC
MVEYEEREDWYERCGIARRYRYARRELIPDVAEFWCFAGGLKQQVKAGNGLLVFGGVGVGKTMALSFLADRARQEALEVRFVFAPDLFDLFIALARARSDEERAGLARIDELENCDLLLLDDFGVEYVGSDYVIARFESFVEHRHRACLSTVVTTNLSPSALNDAGVWRRVVDRWHQTCRPVVFAGKSQRRGGPK